MNGTEIAGIGIFLGMLLIGVSTAGGVGALIVGGFGLLIGLPIYIWGVSKRTKENQTNAVLTENPTIIVKEVSLGHFEERQEYVGGIIEYQTVEKWFSSATSSDGWTARIRWISGYSKQIKYIWFYVNTYNDVGDLEPCIYKNNSKFSCKVTGPINKGNRQDHRWENLLYSKVHITPVLTGISVEFMDGSRAEIEKNDIKWAGNMRW